MGFLSDVVNKIRGAWARDKESVAFQMAKGSTALTSPSYSYDVMQAYGYAGMSDYLRLEADLLSRYVDYEEMDDYAPISSALTIYADDATQVDSQTNRTIWVTSADHNTQTELDDLVNVRLRLDEEVWEIGRTLCKYGCLPADTRVLTVSGEKAIVQVGVGDEVYVWSERGLERAPVRALVPQGRRQLYRLRTKHRELRATDNHPFLVEDAAGVRWLPLEELRSGTKICISTRTPVTGVPVRLQGRIPEVGEDAFVLPSERLVGLFREREDRTQYFISEDHVLRQHPSAWKAFLRREYGVRLGFLRKLCALLGVGFENGDWQSSGGRGGQAVSSLTLPEFVTPDFCRYLGFLYADGWFVDTPTGSRVEANLGKDTELAERYLTLLRQWLPTAQLVRRAGCWILMGCSKALVALHRDLGWIDGAHHKRVPGWLYGLDEPCREAFLEGFEDGDGWRTNPPTWNRPAHHIELCNRELLLDLKRLIDGLGYRSGLVRYRHPRSHVLQETGRTIHGRGSWILTYSRYRFPESPFRWERVIELVPDGEEDVFDIQVDHPGHNFVAEGVVVHNSDYEELLVTADGVMGLNFLPPPTVRRIEGPRGELFGFIQDFQGRFGYTPEEFKAILAKRTSAIQSSGGSPIPFVEDGVAALEDWEVVNFRLRGKARRSVYGSSVLEAARWIWKRLILLEDTALIYRLQRAPERFAFYIDVGDLPPAEAMAYLNKVKNQYKKKSYVNPSTGKVDLKFNALSSDEDFFIPVRQGTEGAKVEVIAGPVWQHMEDIEYFLNHLFSAIAIPKAYLAQDENVARAVLSSEDVRFARSVLRVQRELRNGVSKVCRVHLAALGARPEDHRFDIHLPVPSAIFELSQIEARNARAELAARLKEFMSLHWIYKNVFNLSDSDIELVIKQQEEDSKRLALMQANAEAAAQQVAMTSQAAMQNMQPPPTPGLEPGVGMESRLLVRPRNVPLYVPGRPLLPLGIRPMTEEELFRGHGRDSEKRAHDKLEKLLKNDVVLRRSIEELRGVVQDLVQLRR